MGTAALSYLVGAIVDRYALTPDDRVLMFTQPHFDVALEEILPTLAVGARLVVPQSDLLGGPELVAVSAARSVTVANLPTSYLLTVGPELAAALRDGRWRPRLLVVGGERVTGESLRELAEAGTATVLNAYGVTEATVTSTVHEVTEEDLASPATVPLGTDLPGTRTYVVDRSGRPLPTGAVGEIAVAGPGLARGYLHDEPATERAFRQVDALGGQRVYRTGDRGYRDAAGRLHFVGRVDEQIKFRGYRIEPGEVRAVLVDHPRVRDAYVLLTTAQGTGEAQLVAYVEPVGDDGPEHRDLRAYLGDRLPEHLVPSAFVLVPELPRTPVGKIRRDDLPPVLATPVRQDVPLVSDQEEQIARIWREVLGVDRVGRTDNFFDLGGHSLLLLRVHARLVRELRLDLPVVTLFRFPTIEAIAAHLAGADGDATGRPDLGQARLAGRDRLSRARARRGGDDPSQEPAPLDRIGTQP
ncbi:Phosphopantetheine attachment site [Micromonospora pallida]|uniref:Phosphopantetheine attachment site n=1 Tax=Micromonospora pallida TaxID=145854 RepID=A0A1C6S9J1_9ACTN|nr:Phosphopantetheine attachment site [Micromonospora pallida]